MADVFLKNNSARSVSDRAQRIAFWVSIAGAVLNTLLFCMYMINDGLSSLLITNFLFYMIPLSAIALSSYNNWNFQLVLDGGIAVVYFYMWGTTFYDAIMGHPSALSFPTLLFIPFLLILVTRYQLLVAYAFLQAGFVYAYASRFMVDAFELTSPDLDPVMIAILLALLSTITLLTLAIVAYSRQKTDNRLLALVQETERMAAQDPLTELKNRRAFMDDIERLWATKIPFAVAFIDLDRFKPLNDEFGHAAGDHVLQTIASRLQSAPHTVSAARLGGDEFAVLMKDHSNLMDARAIAEGLYKRVISEIDIDGAKVSVGASLGYAESNRHGYTVAELLHAADTAMMRSKSSGGGIAAFDPMIDASSLSAAVIEELFRKALNNGDIRPALQPIVDARSRATIGYELLSRWPNSGLPRDPSPVEFIPVAEKLGLLNDLLWATLSPTLSHLADRGCFLAINVSPSQLSNSSFLSDLRAIVDQHAFALDRIEIEITEHVAFRNLDENIRVLEQARAMGCRIVWMISDPVILRSRCWKNYRSTRSNWIRACKALRTNAACCRRQFSWRSASSFSAASKGSKPRKPLVLRPRKDAIRCRAIALATRKLSFERHRICASRLKVGGAPATQRLSSIL